MQTIAIASGRLSARVSPAGGALADAVFGDVLLLRPYDGDECAPFDPLKSASFPLVPFGNRVEGNRFTHAGQAYALAPNVGWDPHYLHGDGWLLPWRVTDRGDDHVVLALESRDRTDTPYAFAASQRLSVAGETLSIALELRNAGEHPLPFGIGHHCYFPLTPATTLEAPARAYWTEKDAFLPDALVDLPEALDFAAPRTIPRRWVNNGFEGWGGRARIARPERGLAAEIEAGPPFSRYFLFHSDTSFEPDFADDYFCFEPMTHSANGHNLPDLGGLKILAPGEAMTATFTIAPKALT